MKAFADANPLQRMAELAKSSAIAAFIASQNHFMTASEVAVYDGLAQI